MPMKLAFVFPGQGSQSVGMLSNLAQSQPEIKATFAAASEVLGYDLWQLVQEGPERALMATERTQPAMLTAGVAVWKVWRTWGGPQPHMMAGHSLGEYTALVCAGAMNFADAVALVADRGRFMQEAVPHGVGAIAAILGLAEDEVELLCEEESQEEVVTPVNYNAPGQIVIAGHTGAVDRVLQRARASGAKRTVVLPMSVPAHSPLMQEATARFEKRLVQVPLSHPRVPILHNTDVSSHNSDKEIRKAMARQLASPVRWAETIRAFAEQGMNTVIECGPGKVLTTLCKRINRRLNTLPVFDESSLKTALQQTRELDHLDKALRHFPAALGYTGA